MDSNGNIVLHLVGVPHVAKPMKGVFPAKGYVLAAMLLLCGGRRMSRQTIAALLWDDAPEEKALTNLRQLLARINRFWPLDQPLIEAEGSNLMVGPGGRYSDLAQIMTRRKSQVLAERVAAVRLVRGDLLDTLDTGGPELSQWFRSERERFRRQVLGLAGEVLMEMTQFARAKKSDIDEIGERMLALEPEREESFRALIEAYGRIGDIEEAGRVFDDLKKMLREEFGIEPRPETAATMRRILANAPRPRLQVVSETEVSAVRDQAARPPALRNLAGLPRVSLFPPQPRPGETLHPLYRMLIEDVANSLSRHATFAVTAPHSSFDVADSGDRERLAALRSGYLVTGFLVPGSQKMALRLTRNPGDEIIWATEYQVELENLAVAFRMISHRIAATLASEIERDQLERLRADPKPLAYRHYLEGHLLFKNCDLPRLRRARVEFQKAAAIDKDFAGARGAVSNALQLEWLMLGANDPSLLMQARHEAEAAISIDAGNSVGHWMSAVIALHQRDYEKAAEQFLEAETLNPNSADLLESHGDTLAHLGDPDAGWERFQRAVELNPFPPDRYWWGGATIAYFREDFEGAIDMCGKMESDQSVLRILAICHGNLGNKEAAKNYGARLKDMYPGITAADVVKLTPDKKGNMKEIIVRGLRVAGIN
ncbi:SARP family transcriptional regulator [Labrys okinawensis]|uniref:SARP family transcriptional regulator n=2 Tax=Labrys okinawensis TaxID=346911 RepID=A0A2S9QHW1_9HYPH|nr:SARP family transcriptional regulator [Labrys okinawensis]